MEDHVISICKYKPTGHPQQIYCGTLWYFIPLKHLLASAGKLCIQLYSDQDKAKQCHDDVESHGKFIFHKHISPI